MNLAHVHLLLNHVPTVGFGVGLGLLVLSLGWALAFRSPVGVLLAALNILPLVARIRSEEALLRSQFGEEYAAYCARTWRLVPGIY